LALTCEKFDKNKKYLRQQKKLDKLPTINTVVETPNKIREISLQNDCRLSTYLKSRMKSRQESLCKISFIAPNRDQKLKPPRIIFSESDLTRQKDSSIQRTALIDSFNQINHLNSDLDRSNFFAYTITEKEYLLLNPLQRRNFNDFHFRRLVRNKTGACTVYCSQLFCWFPKKYASYDEITEEQSLANNQREILAQTSNFVDIFKSRSSNLQAKTEKGINNVQKHVFLAYQKQSKEIDPISRDNFKNKSTSKSLKIKYVTKWLKMIESLLDGGALNKVSLLD